MVRIFFHINQLVFFPTESTTGVHPRTGTAKKLHLSFPNRIFWNFYHKPHFANAIPHSVRSFKIRSIQMVWIFFLSTNWNILQLNQLRASTFGSEPPSHSIYLFEIESSATFLTSHISTMLYHIMSGKRKNLGQFRWSGFVFLSTIRNCFSTESTIGHLPPDRNCMDNSLLSLPNRVFCNFSHKPHFHKAISHIVSETSRLGQFRWSGFFSYQQTENIFSTESTIGHPLSGRNRSR